MSHVDLQSLDARTRDIYEFLKDKILNRGYGPTLREIENEFEIRSPNGVVCHLQALEERGLIIRESHLSRAIRLAEEKVPEFTVPLLSSLSGNSLHTTDEVADFGDLFDGDTFCVQVNDCMCSGQNILEGDFIVLARSDEYSTDDTVLMTINDKVEIRPWASDLPNQATEIVGKIIGVIRSFGNPLKNIVSNKEITGFRVESYGLFIDLNDAPAAVAVNPTTGDVLLDEGVGPGRFHGAAMRADDVDSFIIERTNAVEAKLAIIYGTGKRHELGTTCLVDAAQLWVNKTNRLIQD